MKKSKSNSEYRLLSSSTPHARLDSSVIYILYFTPLMGLIGTAMRLCTPLSGDLAGIRSLTVPYLRSAAKDEPAYYVVRGHATPGLPQSPHCTEMPAQPMLFPTTPAAMPCSHFVKSSAIKIASLLTCKVFSSLLADSHLGNMGT